MARCDKCNGVPVSDWSHVDITHERSTPLCYKCYETFNKIMRQVTIDTYKRWTNEFGTNELVTNQLADSRDDRCCGHWGCLIKS